MNDDQTIFAEVTYINAFEFLKDICLMFTDIPSTESMVDFGCLSFIDTLYDSNINSIT